MYYSHFGLKGLPFGITPDTEFYFASKSYQEAFNTLVVALDAGEGFIKITGEVGTGKTLLCRKLMKSLGKKYKVAYIPNPYLEPLSFLWMLATELGISVSMIANQNKMLAALNDGLMKLMHENIQVLVCLDEAQSMPIETLEALRLLSNLETEKRKLVQVVIFGQPELDEKLDQPSIRQLRQRIDFEYELGRLSREELSLYLYHRLHIAGYHGGTIFSSASIQLLYKKSGGTPRLVNILAHKALMVAYGRGIQEVGVDEMRLAIEDTKAVSTIHSDVKKTNKSVTAMFKFWLRDLMGSFVRVRG